MTVRRIVRMGDPRLRQIAEPITEFDTPQLHALVADMFDTMAAERGAGLAAPQIGVGLRVVVFGFEENVEENPNYPERPPVPITVLVNPEIEPLGEAMDEGWEGCLSVPGLRGLVPRYTHIRYTGFDQYGRRIDRTVEGFHARVAQHECDHLDGILYPQRMRDMSTFGFVEELSVSGALGGGRQPCEDERAEAVAVE